MLQAVTQGPRFLPSCASVICCIPRACPCSLHLPHMAADGEREQSVPGACKWQVSLCALSTGQASAVPCAARGTELQLLPGAPQEMCVSAPLRLSGPPLGGFWGQDLSASLRSGESSPGPPHVIPKVSEKQAGTVVPVTVASRFKFWYQTWDERKALIRSQFTFNAPECVCVGGPSRGGGQPPALYLL